MVRDFLGQRMKEENYVGYVGHGIYKIGPGAYTNIDGWRQFQKALLEKGYSLPDKINKP